MKLDFIDICRKDACYRLHRFNELFKYSEYKQINRDFTQNGKNVFHKISSDNKFTLFESIIRENLKIFSFKL